MSRQPTPARVLLVADEGRANLWTEALQALGTPQTQRVADAPAALRQLGRKAYDAAVVHAAEVEPALALLDLARARARHRVPALVFVHDQAEPAARAELEGLALRHGALVCLGPACTPGDVAQAVSNVVAFTRAPRAGSRIDAVTGLPEREVLGDQLAWALHEAQRGGSIGALLHIDLDRFDQISEALGRGLGERLLRITARQLQVRLLDLQREAARSGAAAAGGMPVPDGGDALLGSEPTLARIASTSFVALLPRIDSAFAAETVARQLLQAIARPQTLDGHEVVLGAHVGISVFPHDGLDSETLLKCAATAARHAREADEGPCQFYRSDLNARTLRRLGLESELRRTVERGELELFFQPKAHVKTGLLTGAEALLRWNRPGHGLVSPGEFVPLAEETGLIVPLGQWVLDAACRQIRTWQVEGLRVPRISFNASALQLRSPQFVPAVMRTIRDVGIDGSCLTLEVTETAVMSNSRDAIRLLQVLKRTGARISIDDFGTGYSSLSYLRRLPVDEIKIDRSFLNDVERGGEGAVVAAAIISMGHSLGYKVVAEGVENDAQLDFLRAHGCDEFQGYLLSQPLPAGTFGEVIAGALADSAVQSHTS